LLNFNHLYYFHVVATEGSIKAAADRLGVTQPTVSEQLRMLERALRVDLFERTSGGLKLSQAGRDALEHTTAMFIAGERLVESLGHTQALSDIVLRVGVSASTARTLATDFLMPVLTVENCRPSIRTGDFNEMLRAVRSNELDLVIGEAELGDAARSGLEVDLVYKPLLVALAQPDIEPRPDWKNLSLLEYRKASVYHWEVENYLQTRSLHPATMGEADDALLMLEAVLRGGLVAFVPKSMARAAIRQGAAKVLAQFTPVNAAVYAIYPSVDAPQMARTAVERLIAHARSSLDES
jgi:LysR family transcriptional activator of nhaA